MAAMVVALQSFAPHHAEEEEEEKILTLDIHLTTVNPRQNRYTPNDSKWATPLQVDLPSLYRPRRRAPYNVGPFPTLTFLSTFLTYMCTCCTTPICSSFLGFRSWPKIFTTTFYCIMRYYWVIKSNSCHSRWFRLCNIFQYHEQSSNCSWVVLVRNP